jgi:putative tryptophan/tyrosine transport system substrate-binding protein
MLDLKRREFITLLGSAGLLCGGKVRRTRAQQPAMPVVGYLSTRSPDDSAYIVTAFRNGLNEIGYLQGQNVAIEYRYAEGHYDRLSTLAAELIHRPVNVLVATGGTAASIEAKIWSFPRQSRWFSRWAATRSSLGLWRASPDRAAISRE